MSAGAASFNREFRAKIVRKNRLEKPRAGHRLAGVMAKEEALRNFRKPPLRLNCAQTIAHGFGREDLVSALSACGSGNAPDGLCGALFCAMKIVGENDAPAVVAEFEKRLGYRHCARLKGEGKVPCTNCVACAAEILEARGF